MTNKEAIEQLKQMPINPEASYEYMKTIYQAIDMAIKALEGRPQGEWIPVSVQEPNVGGMYLVTAKDISGHIGIDIARRISVGVWTFGGEELSGVEIIAWQPTPKPYKEAENEENNS